MDLNRHSINVSLRTLLCMFNAIDESKLFSSYSDFIALHLKLLYKVIEYEKQELNF